MADHTATDEAIDELARAFHEAYESALDGGRQSLPAPRYHYETRKASVITWEALPEKRKALMRATVDALPAGLLRRLADQKDGGPLFEGTVYRLREFVADRGHGTDLADGRWVVVYPAPETTT
jgi:hypothetical protein